jgi:2-methylcitrate dehydratase PrpD
MTTSASPDAQRAADGPTRLLARWVAGLDDDAIGPAAMEWSRHALLDWLAVTLAGTTEPLARMLRDEYAGPHGDAPCTLPGTGRCARVHDAALVNGATGHALDFDDVSARMLGHPTAPVAPAALAFGQVRGVSGRALLRALVVGHEVEARIGEWLGTSHYAHGFHTTGTIGSFGAAAACATLAGLDAARAEQALGLAATQAAGLKCMFGTMAKPLHAGRAAMNGVMAVQLAARGFTARDGAIECEQGFARTQAPAAGTFPAAIDTRDGFAIETTLFKYHASCYLTHSTIEAVRLLRERHGLALADLDALTIAVPRTHRGVCDIVEPRTGLEVKFSIRHLAALALAGVDTASLDLYTDAIALDERYGAARARVSLVDDDGPDRHAARVTIRTRDGRSLAERCDVGVPARDAAAQWQRLVAKARTITVPVIGGQRFERLVAAIAALDSAPTLQPLLEAIA